MTIYGYANVSTDGRSVDDEVKQLKAAGVVTVFHESVSGNSRETRPALLRAIAGLGRGDMLVVTRLDRLDPLATRSLEHHRGYPAGRGRLSLTGRY